MKSGARRRAWLGTLLLTWHAAIVAPAQARAQSRDVVPLEAVLAHSNDHAPLIIAARARIEEGVAERVGAERLLTDPLRVDIGGGPRVADGSDIDFDAIVALSQPIEIGSERGLRIAAADRLSDRREAELEAVRWQVHREIHFAFHEAIEARVRLEAERAWLALAERLADIARTREAAGEVGRLDLAMAIAELAAVRQRVVESEGHFLDARLRVAELAGWPATSPPMPAGGLDAPGNVPAAATLVARARDSHPALRALASGVAEARARRELADREATPALDVGLSFAREGSAGSPANYIGLVTLGMSLPVWNPRRPEREAARAREVVAEAELRALASAIEARVLRAVAAVGAAAERVRIFENDVLPGFQENLTLLARAFELGELDALEVGTATRRLLDVQGNALDAFAEYHRALAELESEVGAEVIEDTEHAPARADEGRAQP